MDTFKLPMHKVKSIYTRSELVLMAFDSREKAYHMQLKYDDGKNSPSRGRLPMSSPSNGVRETIDSYELPEGVNNGIAIPKVFFNDEGEVDLRQVTGPQAVRYLRSLGVNIVMRM